MKHEYRGHTVRQRIYKRLGTNMRQTITLFVLILTLPVSARSQTAFDRKQVEREVISVLDVFMDAFNRQDARAEERTYQFPHYRLAIAV